MAQKPAETSTVVIKTSLRIFAGGGWPFTMVTGAQLLAMKPYNHTQLNATNQLLGGALSSEKVRHRKQTNEVSPGELARRCCQCIWLKLVR
jgi:hypothetical protein